MTVGEALDILSEYERGSTLLISPEMTFTDDDGNEILSRPGLCVGEEEELYFLGEVQELQDIQVDFNEDDDPYADDEDDEYPDEDD